MTTTTFSSTTVYDKRREAEAEAKQRLDSGRFVEVEVRGNRRTGFCLHFTKAIPDE